jgi:hypothetical protein
VSYSVDGPLRDVVNCHCDRCRRITGHFMAATATAVADMVITDPGSTLSWYEPTHDVGYGFCRSCGSTLFWRSADRPDVWSIAAGTLDQPTGLTTTRALFVAEAGDYHRLDHELDEVPYDGGVPPGV